MSKTYRPFEPKQKYLLPPSPEEWLPEGHLAYFIQDLVETLDLRPLFAFYERDHRGAPPHHPRMMVGLLLYAYCVGVPSSRKIELKTHEDVAFRVLAAGNHPDHTRIAEFRRLHSKLFSGFFVQVLKLCRKAGLVSLGHVALDGTKEKANASKHKAMSYGRMKEQEVALQQKVKDLLAAAEAADADEDQRFGKSARGDELPKELQFAQSRLKRLQEAKAELEAEAKEAQEQEQKDKNDPPSGPSSQLPEHQVPHLKDGTPTDKAQRNFTDPESRIQKTGDGFIQGYNGQAMVDEHSQIIVAQALTNQSPDPEHLVPMVALMEQNLGTRPEKFSADAGYFSEANLQVLAEKGIEAFIPPRRQKHGQAPPPSLDAPPPTASARERMEHKLKTQRGREEYAKRKGIVEPVFGQIKEVRGFRQLLRRGLDAAQSEWALICTTHNLLKLFRAGALVA
jgi:transposase